MLDTAVTTTLAAATSAIASDVSPIADLFAWLAGGIGIFVGVPQVWRLWAGRRHAGLSLTSNVLAVVFSAAWLLYGVASHRPAMIVTCLIGFGVAGSILAGHVYLSRPPTRAWLPLTLIGWTVVVSLFFVGRGPLGLVASAATISGVLPQLVVLVQEHRHRLYAVGGVSISRWVLAFSCNVLWATYGVLVHDPLIVANSTIIAVLSLGIAALTRNAAQQELLLVVDARELAGAAA